MEKLLSLLRRARKAGSHRRRPHRRPAPPRRSTPQSTRSGRLHIIHVRRARNRSAGGGGEGRREYLISELRGGSDYRELVFGASSCLNYVRLGVFFTPALRLANKNHLLLCFHYFGIPLRNTAAAASAATDSAATLAKVKNTRFWRTPLSSDSSKLDYNIQRSTLKVKGDMVEVLDEKFSVKHAAVGIHRLPRLRESHSEVPANPFAVPRGHRSCQLLEVFLYVVVRKKRGAGEQNRDKTVRKAFLGPTNSKRLPIDSSRPRCFRLCKTPTYYLDVRSVQRLSASRENVPQYARHGCILVVANARHKETIEEKAQAQQLDPHPFRGLRRRRKPYAAARIAVFSSCQKSLQPARLESGHPLLLRAMYVARLAIARESTYRFQRRRTAQPATERHHIEWDSPPAPVVGLFEDSRHDDVDTAGAPISVSK